VRFPKCSTPLSYGLGDMEVLNMTGNGGGIFLDYGLREAVPVEPRFCQPLYG